MAMKAKHAFGTLENIDAAISAGKIDSYDILFVKDENGKPYVGWIDKNGQKVIVDDSAELAALEAKIATKVDAEDLAEVDAKITTKVDAAEVDAKIADALGKLELEAEVEYEISHKPEGTLIDYRDKEIRVMCPANTKWAKQNVGANGNANMYYMGFKAYAPEGAVSFKEDDQMVIADQTMYYFENNEFAGIDKNGRKYSIVWLALASYDESSDTWSYFGASSSAERYIGWYYSVEWYDADGVMIASDCIRINLSNESCHSEIKPYYWNELNTELNTKIEQIEEKIEEVTTVNEVVEF